MKFKKLAVLLGVAFFSLVATSCGGNVTPTPPEPEQNQGEDKPPVVEPPSVTNPTKYIGITDQSKKVTLKAPFFVFEEDGTKPTDLIYKHVQTGTNKFNNMYQAIRIAGENSTTKRKLQVQDSNFVQIFARQRSSQWFVFDGHDYIGTDGKTNAKAYIDNNKNAYAMSGDGKNYQYLGRDDYSKDQTLYSNVLELNAGAYNYMFSQNGVGKGENGGNINGFSYVTADVRLSEMRYRPTNDGDGWNAYIFINIQAHNHSDLGLIGNIIDGKLQWRMVRNCGSKYHGSAGFSVYHDKVVTVSTKYDKETNEYYGCDDLHFEAIGLTNGWILNITNLRTKEVHTFEDLHYEADGVTPMVDNPVDKACYYRALIASSYCPVVGNIWNWDSGAALKNVLWENIEMQRYVDDNPETYRKADNKKYELYPDTKETLRDGYSQGAFAASHKFGKHEKDGTYASGAPYKKGDKYLSQSVSYTNPW